MSGGDRVTLQIFADGFPEVIGFGFNIEYDQGALSFVEDSFETGSFLTGTSPLVTLKDGGIVDVGTAVLGGTPAGGDGHLASLDFTVNESFADSTHLVITALGYTLSDGSFQELTIRMSLSLIEGTALLGDFNGDGSVGFADFLMFAGAFGKDGTGFDLTGDGSVGFQDFLIFAGQFGKSTRPTIPKNRSG